MDTPQFYVALFFHLSGLILGFGAVMVTDLYGLLWIRDRVRFPQVVRVSGVTEGFIWAGWGIMVMAGIPLILLKGVVDSLMIIKLFFVVVIGLNGIPLHLLHKRVRGYEEGEDVPTITMFRLMLCLGISQLGWWGAVLIGFLHRHVQSIIQWPDAPWLLCAGILGALLAVWGAGELFLRRKHLAQKPVKETLREAGKD